MKSVKDALRKICLGCTGISAALVCFTCILASIGLGRDLSLFDYISSALLTVLVAVESIWIIHVSINYLDNELTKRDEQDPEEEEKEND